MNTIRRLSQYALQELKDTYNPQEIQSLCRIVYLDVLQYTKIDIHIRKNDILDESFVDKFFEIVRLLKDGHPLQYILGETEFSGLKFELNPSTLIPRPETEELVLLAQERLTAGKRVLDIGTGSGCIAISLAVACPEARVTGIDISPEAVEAARTNALRHGAKTEFLVRDILHFETDTWQPYHLIVSNPPYVRECEKQGMQRQVLEHEPHRALFVPDADPLLFYRRIAEFGCLYLLPAGYLYFEINEALGNETVSLLEKYGYRQVQLIKDLFGKDRFVAAVAPTLENSKP